MVKCNNSHGKDTTSGSMKDHCIGEMKVLKKEIEIIKPTHIIFYTGRYYDYYIPKVFDEDGYKVIVNTLQPIGKRNIPWFEAEAKIGNMKFNVLRVWHPERKKKSVYVEALCGWIRQTKSLY